MIGSNFEEETLEIDDENLVPILIDWIPCIDKDLQRFAIFACLLVLIMFHRVLKVYKSF